MRINSFFVTYLALLSLISIALAQDSVDLDAPFSIDPDLRVGTLDNGLKYYIRENQKPEGRAMLRLVVNVGSLQEEEDERGLAHFLEHMAFNGTENFAKHDIIDFLEGVGMRFGSHLNASTSFDETIYQLEVPTDKSETVEKAFLILEDWASNILFEEEEIEKERGVVIEEWRGRKGVGQRLMEKQLPLMYFGSKYVDRLPIGLVPVIESLTRDQFVSFYKKWYRPDLMAVVAVGDFETDDIEALIKERFEGLKNPEEAPVRETFQLTDHDETLFSIETDPELSSSSVGVYFKTDKREYGTPRLYRDSLVDSIYFSMMNNRLSERAKDENPPFIGAGLGKGSFGREKGYYRMAVGFIGENYKGGLRGLMQEVERARRDGFEQSELDRVKVNILRSLEKMYDERDKRQSASFLREYINNFLVGESIPGLEKELELNRLFLKNLELAEINAVGNFVRQIDNRLVLYTAPEKDGFVKPEPKQLLSALVVSEGDSLEAYDDGVSDEPLLSVSPKPGQIIDTVFHEAIDTHEWKLSNGIRVVAKATDFKNDEILATAFSPGGASLFSEEDSVSGSFATMVLGQSGLGKFDSIQLGKKLAGKIASAGPSIGGSFESIRGSASPKDLETFFELVHMHFMEPRLDLKAFASVKTRMIASVENRLKSPNAVFADAVNEALYQGHPRHRPISVEMIEEIDPELGLKLYKERFADASDFTFVFVGTLDLEVLKNYVVKYLASLPNLNRTEEGRFNGDRKATGQLEVTIDQNVEEKTVARVMYHGDAEWSPENSYALGFAKDILNIRLRERLREKESKVYGASVSGSLSRLPVERFSTGFAFSCDPGNADGLIQSAREEIERLQTEGPLSEDLEKIRQQRIRSFEKGVKENRFWLGGLSRYLQEERPMETILRGPEVAKAFNGEEAQRAAQLYFDESNRLIAKLNPKSKE